MRNGLRFLRSLKCTIRTLRHRVRSLAFSARQLARSIALGLIIQTVFFVVRTAVELVMS